MNKMLTTVFFSLSLVSTVTFAASGGSVAAASPASSQSAVKLGAPSATLPAASPASSQSARKFGASGGSVAVASPASSKYVVGSGANNAQNTSGTNRVQGRSVAPVFQLQTTPANADKSSVEQKKDPNGNPHNDQL